MLLLRLAQRARSRLRLRAVLAAALALFVVLAVFLPSDNPARLSVRFNAGRLSRSLRPGPAADAAALARQSRPDFPVDFAEDVGVLVKSGYGTQDRIQPSLAALESGLGCKGVVVVADFDPAATVGGSSGAEPTRFVYQGNDIPVVDVLARSLKQGREWMETTPRFRKYASLAGVLMAGRADLAKEFGKKAGWELDALKFIPGMDLLFETLPKKKWYLILDDDTYVIRSSLRLLLERLNPDAPHYLGNPVGDFKGRFGHGGSAVILSRGAMHRLFKQNPQLVQQAYRDALVETWGDKLVATTLLKVGVYLDEDFAPLFNGESPIETRIRPDRACAPLVGFHNLKNLKDGELMNATAKLFGGAGEDVVLWSDVWAKYGGPDLGAGSEGTVREHADYVSGAAEGVKVVQKVEGAERCARLCAARATCLAWTWTVESKACKLAPEMRLGRIEEERGTWSGVNAPRAKQLMERCQRPA